jgi:hypothetical protein
MEKDEKQRKNISWLKSSIIPIIIIVIVTIYLNNKIESNKTNNPESITPSKVILDFQNESGVSKIKTAFTDILIGSAGSRKRDDGYELRVNIINPSSIALRNISGTFQHINSDKSASCNEINMIVYPGKSRIFKCFISDLSDYELNAVEVIVDFEQISFYK